MEHPEYTTDSDWEKMEDSRSRVSSWSSVSPAGHRSEEVISLPNTRSSDDENSYMWYEGSYDLASSWAMNCDSGYYRHYTNGPWTAAMKKASKEDFLSERPEYDNETSVKERREHVVGNPNSCKGKTRRRKCFCTQCRQYFQGKLVGPQGGRMVSQDRSEVLVTNFDTMNFPTSLNKRGNWKLLRETLAEEAISFGTQNASSFRDIRKREVFRLEATGKLIVSSNTGSTADARPTTRKPFKRDTYYTIKTSKRASKACLSRDEDLSAYVREYPIPEDVSLADDEHLCEFLPSAHHSKRSKQTTSARLCFPMVSRDALKNEIKDYGYSMTKSWSWSYGYQYICESNHRNCWGAEHVSKIHKKGVPDAEYQEWFLEMDCRRSKMVRGIILQGRAPTITQFPTKNDFLDEAEMKNYTGPIYPIITPTDKDQWVEECEVFARCEGKNWFSLGCFRGNSDALTPVRIDLDIPFAVRYLRVRPLSQAAGGFHGDSPSMRCAVIAENDGANDSQAELGVGNYQANHIEYELWTPDAAAAGVIPASDYVSGKAIKLCSRASHYKYYSGYYSQKHGSVRYQKRKDFQAMLKEEC